MLGNGLLGTVLGVRAELEGFATATTGIVMAFYYVGFLAGSQVVPTMVGRVGYVRAFAGLASLASISALLPALAVQPALWGGLRFVTGLCQAGLYVVAESWLNELTTNRHRGRILSAYMVVIMGGAAGGQFFLAAADPASFQLFVLASVLISLSVVPVSLSIGTAPHFEQKKRLAFRDVWHAAPLGIAGGLGTGLTNGAFLAMGAIYAFRVGMSPSRLALFISAALIGSVVLQIPIGAASDRVHRRRAILVVTMAAAGMAAFSATLDPLSLTMLVATFFYGGLSFPLYSLSLGHINDVIPEGQKVGASSVFVFVTGLGAIIGPLAASWALNVVGVAGFWWLLAVIQALMGVFAVTRIWARPPVPIDEQGQHEVRPGAVAGVGIRRPASPERPGEITIERRIF